MVMPPALTCAGQLAELAQLVEAGELHGNTCCPCSVMTLNRSSACLAFLTGMLAGDDCYQCNFFVTKGPGTMTFWCQLVHDVHEFLRRASFNFPRDLCSRDHLEHLDGVSTPCIYSRPELEVFMHGVTSKNWFVFPERRTILSGSLGFNYSRQNDFFTIITHYH